MISKKTALATLNKYHTLSGVEIVAGDNPKLKITRGNFEYLLNVDAVNYNGDGAEFLVADLNNFDGWTSHGVLALVGGELTLDGASWLEHGAVTLGGKDFQISGKAYENADDMIVRRKIFELYTSPELNVSLYSSGAGKNLDLLVNCGGNFDNYNKPAILEREYSFALKWKQDTGTLKLHIDGEEIYSVAATAFSEQKTFNQLLVGASVYHENATWSGKISDFKVYDGYCEA